ncbi:hypothetical protein GCM10011579_004170 [Streptomyces albiflavescens]|uniref:Uncharacterized protein n=1 Tax=Streptomyces albiflavescens TaxID=1623582 RepID=A0A917XSC3_9ACTN|nr:hypothetical protein GCM10011579_004170 [Streptomyces albiflavescens]
MTLYTHKLSGTLVGMGGAPLPADRSVTRHARRADQKGEGRVSTRGPAD